MKRKVKENLKIVKTILRICIESQGRFPIVRCVLHKGKYDKKQIKGKEKLQ